MSTWDEAILNALPGRMQPVTRSVNVSRHSNAAFTKGCPLRRRIAWGSMNSRLSAATSTSMKG